MDSGISIKNLLNQFRMTVAVILDDDGSTRDSEKETDQGLGNKVIALTNALDMENKRKQKINDELQVFRLRN